MICWVKRGERIQCKSSMNAEGDVGKKSFANASRVSYACGCMRGFRSRFLAALCKQGVTVIILGDYAALERVRRSVGFSGARA